MTANRVGLDVHVLLYRQAGHGLGERCDVRHGRFGRFHGAMLDAGVWLPPSQFEAAFLSIAHTKGDIDDTLAAAREAFALV